MIFKPISYCDIISHLHLDISKIPSAQKAPKSQYKSPRLQTMGKVEKYPYLNDDGKIIYLTTAEIKIRNEVKAARVQAAREEDDYRRQETRAERMVRKDRERAKREAQEERARARERGSNSSRSSKSSGRKR